MRFIQKLAFLFSIALLLLTNLATPVRADSPPAFPNCRLGIGGAFAPYVGGYDMAQLNTGLYQDWASHSNPASQIGLPANIEFIQTVRVHQDKVGGWDSAYVQPPTYTVSPSLATIASVAASQRGALWLIGNEIERRDWANGHQDEITPELYAQAFHDIRAVIKTADPTARIAIAGLIQATPLRLKYLDRVWDSYYTRYGYPMGHDIDAWNIHGFILHEARNEWGADIPAGLEQPADYLPQEGFLYGASFQTAVEAHDNMVYYRQFLESFRAWMAAHGERNKPLLNTEYGILYNIGGSSEVIKFLTNTFDYMFSATNAQTGYPADENRLLQGWIWYSLNDNISYFQYGTLFNSNKSLTAVGNGWKNYVRNSAYPLAALPQRNLLAVNLATEPNPASVFPMATVIVTLRADIANSGNTSTNTGNNITVRFRTGVPGSPGSTIIASRTLASIPGCGRYTTVTAEWPDRPVGNHPWYVEIVPIPGEANTSDNTTGSTAVVLETMPQIDLAVVKKVNKANPFTGKTVNYSVTATNKGPYQAQNVQVTDLLPPSLSLKSLSTTQGLYYSNGIWEVGTLASTASATLTLTAQVKLGQGGQLIVNTASITSPFISDPVAANNKDSVGIIPIESKLLFFPFIFKKKS